MHIREATVTDIPKLHTIRMEVKENILSNPALVTEAAYTKFISLVGKGWVCEMNGIITGFVILDLINHNVWALFVSPEFEGTGVGRKLHDKMLTWYFENYSYPLNLGTNSNTRAESFYRKAGWHETGTKSNNEIAFEMRLEDWKKRIYSAHP